MELALFDQFSFSVVDFVMHVCFDRLILKFKHMELTHSPGKESNLLWPTKYLTSCTACYASSRAMKVKQA